MYMPACVCLHMQDKHVWVRTGVCVYGHASIYTWLSACVHECVFLSVSMQVLVPHIYILLVCSQRTLTDGDFNVTYWE